MRATEIEKLERMIIEKDEVFLPGFHESRNLKSVAQVDVNYKHGIALEFYNINLVPNFIKRKEGEIAKAEFIKYGVSTTMLVRLDYNGGTRLVLNKHRVLRKKNLRKYPRVDTIADFGVYEIDKDGMNPVKLKTSLNRMMNISGGGFLLYAWKDVSMLSKLLLKIYIHRFTEETEICTEARIAWKNPVIDNPHLFAMGLEFTNIETTNRRKIISYVMDEQNARRKLGQPPESL